MAQINLLDSDNKPRFKVQSYAWLVKVLVVVLVLIFAYYGYLFYRQNNLQKQINDTRSKTQKAQNAATANSDRKELLTRQGQLGALNPLLKTHLYWSSLLPELARVSLQRSDYVSIDAVSDESLSLSVKLPSYADADKFLQVFDLPEYNRQFSNVRVLSIVKSTDEGGAISYLMRVQLDFSTDFLKSTNQ
jgi:Tfp pilus assembly protein PilO